MTVLTGIRNRGVTAPSPSPTDSRPPSRTSRKRRIPGSLVLRPDRPMPPPATGPSVRLRVDPSAWEGWLFLQAEVSSPGWTVATFYADRDGPGPAARELIAVDDTEPAQWVSPIAESLPRTLLFDATGLTQGTPVQFTVVVRDLAGHQASAHLDIKIARNPDHD
jgi:hypothetical protein